MTNVECPMTNLSFRRSSLVPTLHVGTQPSDAPRQSLDAERRRKQRSHVERGNEKMIRKSRMLFIDS